MEEIIVIMAYGCHTLYVLVSAVDMNAATISHIRYISFKLLEDD